MAVGRFIAGRLVTNSAPQGVVASSWLLLVVAVVFSVISFNVHGGEWMCLTRIKEEKKRDVVNGILKIDRASKKEKRDFLPLRASVVMELFSNLSYFGTHRKWNAQAHLRPTQSFAYVKIVSGEERKKKWREDSLSSNLRASSSLPNHSRVCMSNGSSRKRNGKKRPFTATK